MHVIGAFGQMSVTCVACIGTGRKVNTCRYGEGWGGMGSWGRRLGGVSGLLGGVSISHNRLGM